MEQFTQLSTTIYMFTYHKILLIGSCVHGSFQADDYDYTYPDPFTDHLSCTHLKPAII